MKKLLTIIAVLLIFACKSNNKPSIDKGLITQEINNEDLKVLKQGINNFWEVNTDSGINILVNQDKIFYYKKNAEKKDSTTRFFLHVKLKTGEVINMDFNYQDHVISAKKDYEEFKQYLIAKRELPLKEIFSINTGQFTQNGRVWQKVLHEQNFY